jgi:hypothetical protein
VFESRKLTGDSSEGLFEVRAHRRVELFDELAEALRRSLQVCDLCIHKGIALVGLVVFFEGQRVDRPEPLELVSVGGQLLIECRLVALDWFGSMAEHAEVIPLARRPVVQYRNTVVGALEGQCRPTGVGLGRPERRHQLLLSGFLLGQQCFGFFELDLERGNTGLDGSDFGLHIDQLALVALGLTRDFGRFVGQLVGACLPLTHRVQKRRAPLFSGLDGRHCGP